MGAWKMQLSGLLMLCIVHTASSACSRRLDMAIETTANRLSAFSGCYNESSHPGLYETVVYTVDGEDLKEGGSPAIMAHEVRVEGRAVTTALGNRFCLLAGKLAVVALV